MQNRYVKLFHGRKTISKQDTDLFETNGYGAALLAKEEEALKHYDSLVSENQCKQVKTNDKWGENRNGKPRTR